MSRGLVPLPKGLTTHKLRHTFASVLIACGEDPISVRCEPVIAREAPEPPPLDLKAYEQSILQALAERGGRASRSEIMAALAEAMADRHSARDLEALPSGPPRWQPRVGKIRARLVQRGWLRADRGRGCEWELTVLGRTKGCAPESRRAFAYPSE